MFEGSEDGKCFSGHEQLYTVCAMESALVLLHWLLSGSRGPKMKLGTTTTTTFLEDGSSKRLLGLM